ncbi:type IV secretion system protein [Campylobacter helveticus]|uniref:type IV secretion system protein n=1 Tax=Campylobacter helveticus TaxID=28898 RepID=UPI00214A55E6|nr:VirB8/TrbF family protein [Campylobacter helveticus]MCR2062010.1 VirB8/TrbF family protein [Campylobacter helveticus]
MAFKETKKDPNFIFKLERNIKAYMLYTIIALAFVSVLLALALTMLVPLKETKPYLVMFSNGESNFVKIANANTDIRTDTALLKNILAGYVINRETINRINDIERYEIIRSQSDKNIWQSFQNIVNAKNSVYTTKNLYRQVKIINVAILSKNVATIDFSIEQSNKARTQIKWFNYRATLAYDFEKNEDSLDTYNSNVSNPTGFIIKEYALTSIDHIEKDEKENQ